MWAQNNFYPIFLGSWGSSGDMLEGGLQLTGQMGQLTGQMTGQIVKEPNNNINNDVTVSTNNDNTDTCDETKNPLPLDQEEKVGKCYNLSKGTSVKDCLVQNWGSLPCLVRRPKSTRLTQ